MEIFWDMSWSFSYLYQHNFLRNLPISKNLHLCEQNCVYLLSRLKLSRKTTFRSELLLNLPYMELGGCIIDIHAENMYLYNTFPALARGHFNTKGAYFRVSTVHVTCQDVHAGIPSLYISSLYISLNCVQHISQHLHLGDTTCECYLYTAMMKLSRILSLRWDWNVLCPLLMYVLV